MIDFEIDEEKLDQITIEDAEDHEEFIRELNYLIMEGLIEVEEDEAGEPRLYATV